jgi:hypothetical protein
MTGQKGLSRWIDSNLSDSLLRWVFAPIEEGMVGCAALGEVALVGSLPVVEIHGDIEVFLGLLDAFVEGLSEGNAEELFLDRAMEAFDETAGLRGTDFGVAVRDLV